MGQGILPWRDIIAELKRTGDDGWLYIQYERCWYPNLLPSAGIGMKAGAEPVRWIRKDLG
ncbi:MAG TPA: hypothetical protein VLM91_07135 [Candidatus Methylomirabilis sp.]|nr:hypothetical protein [Candidatus Methylomirabilis sp.]